MHFPKAKKEKLRAKKVEKWREEEEINKSSSARNDTLTHSFDLLYSLHVVPQIFVF